MQNRVRDQKLRKNLIIAAVVAVMFVLSAIVVAWSSGSSEICGFKGGNCYTFSNQ